MNKWFAVPLLLASTYAGATDNATDQLMARMAALEARVARLEGQAAAPAPSADISPKALDKANWLQCRQGLTRDELTELLGKPNAERVISGINNYPSSETWIYGNGLPASPGGSVIFNGGRVMQCFMSDVKVN